MSTIPSVAKDRAARLEAAASWRLRIEADECIELSDEFIAWLDEPLNQEAYARACATWDTFDDHRAALEMIAIRRDALARARRASLHRFVRTKKRLAAIAASVVLTASAGVGTWIYLRMPIEYTTGIGDRRVALLDDGSRISLDSETAVRVRYSKAVRWLELERGRARFDVAHDKSRPFTVKAGDETVVAVGTSFDVERVGRKVLVTLIEGHVVVRSSTGTVRAVSAPHTPEPVALAAGQELVASADAKPKVVPASLSVVTAWETGRLILNNEPLGEAVERVNRYTKNPLIVDPAVAQLRISGVFNAGDVDSFIDAVTSYFPVQANVNDADQTVLQKRS